MRPSAWQKSSLTETAERYNEALDRETLAYLAARGIDLDAATGFLLGLVVDPDPQHVQYEGRLALPHITPTGVVSMRFRCLEDHGEVKCSELSHGKYEGLAGEETRLYNVMALHAKTDTIAICEGELDAVVSTSSGMPAVGITGVHNFKPYYYRLFEDYERVILIGDGDSAGRTMVATLAHNMANAVRRPMPEGEDVTSFVVANGADAFLSYLTDKDRS